jgi:molecular chaperone GrpE
MSNKENENHKTEAQVSDEGVDAEDAVELVPESQLETELVEECQRSKELLERLQRLQAEFENYRKRMDARFTEATQFASEGILLKMLNVYDNLLRALEIDFAKDPKAAKDGIQGIRQQMDKILSVEGVRPIESAGKQFDPYYQHAVGTRNDPSLPEGVVAEEYQKGYMLREKVLRPAIVCVNRHEIPSIDAVDAEDKTVEKESER